MLSLVTLTVASIGIVIYCNICPDREKIVARIVFLAYYTVVIAAVTVQAVLRNIVLAQTGVAAFFTGVPIVTCMLFLLSAAPLPHKVDSFVIGAEMLISTVLPKFFPGHESYSLPRYLLLFAAMVISYRFFWHLFHKHVESYNHSVLLSENMLRASYLDGLTGILNRRALDKYLHHLSSDNAAVWRVGVLFFDVDNFKHYNDSYSHADGDAILQRVCEIVTDLIETRGNECYLFRYGGEEFILLIQDPAEGDILTLGREVCRAVWNANIERHDNCAYDRITITIGCSDETVEKGPKADYIRAADKQLYIGKNAQKNCVVWRDKIYDIYEE